MTKKYLNNNWFKQQEHFAILKISIASIICENCAFVMYKIWSERGWLQYESFDLPQPVYLSSVSAEIKAECRTHGSNYKWNQFTHTKKGPKCHSAVERTTFAEHMTIEEQMTSNVLSVSDREENKLWVV